jgi:hypothetical protein
MPIHWYKCSKCGQEHSELTMSVQEDPPEVKHCKVVMDRDYSVRSRHGFSAGYSTPILSDGLGVMPHQLDQARAAHPDREYTPDGRLVMRSHADRERYLKEDGYHDNN